MKRYLVAFALVVAAAVVGTGAATADSTWSDPAGDANGAIDVTAVTVANDAAGTVTMRITASHVGGSVLAVFLDTDVNGLFSDATGKMLAVGMPTPGVVLPMAFGRDANGEPIPITVPSYRAAATPTGIELSFAKSELGIDQAFGFYVLTWLVDTEADGDFVPDGDAVWTYVLTTPPPPPPPVKVKPVIGRPVATPAVAGRRMTVTFPVRRSDNGAPLTAGTMNCDPSVAGKTLVHRESFRGGKARLSFVVPKQAKGKSLKVKVTIVSADGLSATQVATFKVR